MTSAWKRTPTRPHQFTLIFLLCMLILPLVQQAFAQSQAIANDAQLMVIDNKYRNRDPVNLEQLIFGVDASTFEKQSKCHYDIDLVWQASLGTSVSNSPIIADLTSDGRKEIVYATQNGFVEVLRGDNGHKMHGWPFAFPKPRSVAADPLLYDIDQDGTLDIVVVTTDAEIVFLREDGVPLYNRTLRVPELRVRQDWYEGLDRPDTKATFSLHPPVKPSPAEPGGSVPAQPTVLVDAQSTTRRLMSAGVWQGVEGWLPDEGVESLQLFLASETPANLRAHAAKLHDVFYSPQYVASRNATASPAAGYVYVDPHVVATPVLGDLEGDGRDELIVAVTYYFSPARYGDPAERARLDPGIDLRMYVASGVAVFDLTAMALKYTVHLDLTTDRSRYRASADTPPVVADIDGDGKREVVVATGVGFVYVVDDRGMLKGGGYPLLVDALHTMPVVEDLDGDGTVEVVVVDANSNVVCFDGASGSEKWEQRIASFATAPPTVGDIDRDGTLDVVVATHEGHLWALSGRDGAVLPHFPMRLHGRVTAPVTLVALGPATDAAPPELRLVVGASDGHVYVIDGGSGCVDRIDVGEPIASAVLADDLLGSGRLSLLVTTRFGNVFCLATSASFHPLGAWPATPPTRPATALEGRHGVFVTDPARLMLRDVVGSEFRLQFTILDARPRSARAPPARYRVRLLVGRRVLTEEQFTAPGTYTIEGLPSPTTRGRATITVELMNELGQTFRDSVVVSFHRGFYRTLKWILVLPFTMMAAALVWWRAPDETTLLELPRLVA